MRNLNKNKRTLYLCQRKIDGELEKYSKPLKIKENYMPTNSQGDLVSIGLQYPMFLRIKTNIKEKDLFHPGDRLYIYVEPSDKSNSLCKDADYEVYKEPMIFINEVEVMLRRLSSDYND